MAIIPFAILIILLVGLYFFQGYAFHKGLKFVFYVCITILLASTIVYYFLPENSSEAQNLLTQQEIEQAEKSYESFYVHAQEGKLDSVEGVTRKKQWQFEYSGDTLEIPEDERSNVMLMVERKETEDNKIEVTHYSSQYIIDRIDYSNKIESPTVILQGTMLKIIPAKEKSVNYSSFKKDFVLTQFDKQAKDSEEDIFSHNIIHGDQVIYIRIPANVQITDDTFIQYVGEED